MATVPEIAVRVSIDTARLECSMLELEACVERAAHAMRMLTTVAAIRRQIRREIRNKFRKLHEEIEGMISVDEIPPNSHNHGNKS